MYEVFINHHSLIISNSVAQDNYKQYEFNVAFVWADFLNKISDDKSSKLWVFCNDLDLAWSSFKSEFTVIKAAGGLVQKEDNFIFIYRNGKWDLPKGKLELNEDIEECAVREVEEECGIDGVSIHSKLLQTYHTYNIEDKMILKETHWYLMKSIYSKGFCPQIEEGIEKVEWKNLNDIPRLMKNSFANIQRVLDCAKIRA
jgi:8-oxo-dGTP pyrophosphatase MutT (NUDIX family)